MVDAQAAKKSASHAATYLERSISFGLVTIPVNLYSAIERRETLSFNYLEPNGKAGVKAYSLLRVAPKDDRTVWRCPCAPTRGRTDSRVESGQTKGASGAASASSSSCMVAGARFELWKRLPMFEFLLSY